MRWAVQVGSVADGTVEGCIQYCKDLEIEGIILTAGAVPGYQETRLLDLAALKAQMAAVEQAGMLATTMQFWPPYPLADDDEVTAALEGLSANMDVMAEAGLQVLAMFSSLSKPVDPAEEAAQWEKFASFYGRLTQAAEKSGIKIATHFSGHRGRSVLAGSEGYRRLFEMVPSAANGLTFCIGNVWNSDGERIYNLIREFAPRIFMVHMRSTKVSWGESPYWWDIPDGPDILKVLQALEEIGYEGDYSCEHMPEIAGQNRNDISVAWATGYIKALWRHSM